jgi:hypothetical protein
MRLGRTCIIPGIVLAVQLSGCGSSAQVKVENQFPAVLFEPRDIHTTIVFDQEFRNYVAKPNKDVTIDLGQAQVDALGKVFKGLFKEVEIVSERNQAKTESDLVIVPSVREVQLSTPSDSYLNVYEVWIKYNLEIETGDGEAIDSWFMPAYGKTPDSFTIGREEAIKKASIVALRDAGAKLVLDFFRIPSVYAWMQQHQRLEETQ